MDYYLALKNEILLLATTWMGLTLYKTRQTEKGKYQVTSLLCAI